MLMNPPLVVSRLAREKRTITAMVHLYCRARHEPQAPCPACRELLNYALQRLDRCPFGEQKTNCVDCSIHCYKPAIRDRIREVMRYAGPRMIVRHPVLAFFHLFDGRGKRLLRASPLE